MAVRPGSAMAVLLALTFLAPEAGAGEPIALTWNAPASCPSRESVLRDVERVVGSTTEHRAVARADVTQESSQHWSLHLSTSVDGAAGDRAIDADSCDALASALALILAWTIDPAKARAASVAGPPPARSTQDTAPPPGPQAPPSFTAIVALEALGDVGTLPSTGLGAEAAVGFLAGPLRAELSGAAWLSQDATQPVHGVTEGAHLQLFEGALRACFRARLASTFELDPCARGSIVSASARGFGDASTFSPSQTTSAWGMLGADLLAAWSLGGPVALRASLGVGFPLTRPPFVIDQQPSGQEIDLHHPPLAAGRATLGAEVHFP